MSNPSEVNLNSLGVLGIKTEREGPRLLVLGAVHGNETCGPRAIERVMADFDSEKLQLVRGNVTFVPISNPLAYQRGQRIGERNLNRNLRVTPEPKDYEDRIANALCPLIGQHDAVLDLHSFQSPGEPFAMIGPLSNEDDLEPFAFSMPEEALALRLGPRRFVYGWMATYAAGVANRVKRAEESGDPAARAQLLNTDPTYGIGTTEYIRSTGGLGITLTAADTVIFLERDWTPAINEQAEDRLHRIGQDRNVTVIILQGVDTIDTDRVAPANELKSAIVGSVIQQDTVRETQ